MLEDEMEKFVRITDNILEQIDNLKQTIIDLKTEFEYEEDEPSLAINLDDPYEPDLYEIEDDDRLENS